jgi:O-antigen/teichoic acid export membrane protein
VLAAMVAIVGALAEGGLTEAAVQRMAAVPPEVAAERARQFFWLRLSLAAVVVGLGLAVSEPIGEHLLAVASGGGLVRWALLGIVATAASGAVSAMLQALGQYARMSTLTLVNAGLTAALAVGLAGLGQLTLLSALVVLGLGTSLASFLVGVWMLPPAWRRRLADPRHLGSELGPLQRTGRWLGLASLFAMLTANLDMLLLSRWAALPVVGTYSLAVSLASKADIVNHSLYTVLLPTASTLAGPAERTAYVRRSLVRGLVICAGLLLLIPLAGPAIVMLYGPEYAGAVELFRLLLLVVAFDVLTTPMLLLPLSSGQPRALAVAEIGRAATFAVVGLLLIPSSGAYGAVAARFAARVTGAAVVVLALRRRRSST